MHGVVYPHGQPRTGIRKGNDMTTTYQIRATDDGGAQDFCSLYGADTLPEYTDLAAATARCNELNARDPQRGYYVTEA